MVYLVLLRCAGPCKRSQPGRRSWAEPWLRAASSLTLGVVERSLMPQCLLWRAWWFAGAGRSASCWRPA